MSRKPHRNRRRVVIVGMGDTGVLVAIHLAKRADVVGIATKPGLVSGQELGLRLAHPRVWERDYWVPFERFKRLDGIRIVHGSVTGLDLHTRTIRVEGSDGTIEAEPYDALVIATGVSNGFWRTPEVQDVASVTDVVDGSHGTLADARSVMVIGGGAAAVSAAWNIAARWPDTEVDLYFPGKTALKEYHPRVWETLSRRFEQRGVGLHGGHRAILDDGFAGDRITSDRVEWESGQPAARADAVVWAIGRATPNTDWLPPSLLDEDGYVLVDDHLAVPGAPGMFAIGDVAASDPLRSSARARADGVVARNVMAFLGLDTKARYKPVRRRWGSVLGAQDNKLEVFSPSGRSMRIGPWAALQPWVVSRAIYKGMRPHKERG